MEDTTESNKRCKRVYIKGHVWSRRKIKMVFYAKPSFRFILVQNGKTDTNLRLENGKVGGSLSMERDRDSPKGKSGF